MSRTDARYLLRIWHHGDEPWRASLRDLSDGGLAEFSGLDELVSYLRSTTTAVVEGQSGGEHAEGGEER